jgi:lycopene cyclase domain-containing protein
MNEHYTYLLILLLSIAGPFILSFDKKVSFYKEWKFLLPAILLPAVFYITWDHFFTLEGVWSFNERYITGLWIFDLPVEEVLFFLVVPYCCLFIYACFRAYFPRLKSTIYSDYLLAAIALVLLIMGILYREKLYTASTFLFMSSGVAIILAFRRFFKDFNSAAFLISYLIILIPFLIVNGFLTAIPVVLYNDAENLNVRIYTIPVEDTIYGMLLVLMNVSIYEKFKSKTVKKDHNSFTA